MREIDLAKPRRAHFIDEARGLDIILMVLYHAGYDLVFIFGVDVPGYRSFAMPYIQPLIAGTFIVLSGIACRYSRSNAKRGVKTFLLGMALTVVTMTFMPEESIYFGILHFMGLAMLLFAMCKPVLDNIPPTVGILVFLLLFVLALHVPEGYFGIAGIWEIVLPVSLYQNFYLLPLGFYSIGADYFPLIPWLFLYFSGSYLGILIVENRLPEWVYKKHSGCLGFLGKRTLIIYMAHQPVIMGILWVIFQLKGKV